MVWKEVDDGGYRPFMEKVGYFSSAIEDSGTRKTKMGKEDIPGTREFLLSVHRERNLRARQRLAGQGAYPCIFRFQWHDGRCRIFYGVAKFLKPFESITRRACFRMRDAAGRKDIGIRGEFPATCNHFRYLAVCDDDLAKRRSKAHIYTAFLDIACEHTHHICCFMRFWERTLAILNHQRKTVFCEELKRLRHTEVGEW